MASRTISPFLSDDEQELWMASDQPPARAATTTCAVGGMAGGRSLSGSSELNPTANEPTSC